MENFPDEKVQASKVHAGPLIGPVRLAVRHERYRLLRSTRLYDNTIGSSVNVLTTPGPVRPSDVEQRSGRKSPAGQHRLNRVIEVCLCQGIERDRSKNQQSKARK